MPTFAVAQTTIATVHFLLPATNVQFSIQVSFAFVGGNLLISSCSASSIVAKVLGIFSSAPLQVFPISLRPTVQF